MKSTEETRLRFKERINEALKTVQDSDELSEALAIIDDLDELVEINALTAEYFYHKNLNGTDMDEDEDYDYWGNPYSHSGEYNNKKLYEYIVHRMDLFLGLGCHGGQWRNSNHWIAVMIKKLSNVAEQSGHGFLRKKSAPVSNPPTSAPLGFPHLKFPGAPTQTPAPNIPPQSMYKTELEQIIKMATNSNMSAIQIVHKTNGSFYLTGNKGSCYLIHEYIPRMVILKDDKGNKIAKFKEADLSGIAKRLAGVVLI